MDSNGSRICPAIDDLRATGPAALAEENELVRPTDGGEVPRGRGGGEACNRKKD